MNRHELREQTRLNLSANFSGKNQNLKNMRTQKFGFKGENTTERDIRVALLAGTFTDAKEIQKVYPEIDAVIADGRVYGTTAAGVEFVSKNQKTLAHWKTFSKFVNTEIVRMDIISNDRENFQTTWDYVETTPFDERPGFLPMSVADAVSPHQNDLHRAIIEGNRMPISPISGRRGLPVHPLSLLAFTICASSRLDVTMDVRVG